jgi:tetratricopeptide (TPR) repeat protein
VVRGRHRDWFLVLAERAEPHLCQGADQVTWLECLEIEHGNLRAALGACTTAGDSGSWIVDSLAGSESKAALALSEPTTNHQPLTTASEAGLRLVAALTSFWIKRSHLAEARHWLDTVLAGAAGASAAARGGALVGAMNVAFFLDDSPSEASLAAEGLALGREAGDKWLTALSLYHACNVASKQSKREQAQAMGEEGLAVARELGDKGVIAGLLRMLGWVAASRADDERERVLHSESLALFRELENTGGIAVQLQNLGGLAQRQGDYERAGALYHEALALFHELNDRFMISIELQHLGSLALAQDDLSTARARYSEGTALARELNFPTLPWFISQLGEVACRQGDYEMATALQQESLALFQGRDERAGAAKAHLRLGTVAQQQGDYPRARAHHAQCLALRPEVGYHHGIAECLEQLAAMAEAEGQPLQAARILGATEALRETSAKPRSAGERVRHDRQAAALRAALGEAACAAAWAAGRTLPLDQVIAESLEAGKTG